MSAMQDYGDELKTFLKNPRSIYLLKPFELIDILKALTNLSFSRIYAIYKQSHDSGIGDFLYTQEWLSGCVVSKSPLYTVKPEV